MSVSTRTARRGLAGLLAAAAVLSLTSAARSADAEAPKKKAPQVEVVFCLDTTGSMGGLIEGAKQKIWAISNQIAGGKPTPVLKIGLVAFRDRGDAYVTKVIDLTDDLDAIHGHLRGFKAEGGGDFPESVNQALHESVTKIKWSTDKDTLRILFLVGDAPPHMDYKDDVKYPETCKLAAERGIIINTVQCGDHPETRKYWQDICTKAEGSYVQIAQDGGVVAVATPYDKDLAKINTELARSTLTYGDRGRQLAGEDKKEAAAGLATAAAADRAAFAGKAGMAASYDLLDGIKSGKVKLEELKKDHLPPELQKLSLKEQKAYLDKLDKRRGELSKEAVELDKKRSDFIAKKLAEDKKNKAKDGFDNQVLEILRKQAKKYQIEY
jgi:Mg-chelatase subunit ChlD